MNTEQIAKLLFATTVVTIFTYLLFFTSIGQAGNGGEYWGYDGFTEPYHAASDAYDRGDYRFLSIDLPDALGKRYQATPAYQHCENHPFGSAHALRVSSQVPLHGADSIRLATTFATRYNDVMAYSLVDKMGGRCEVFE